MADQDRIAARSAARERLEQLIQQTIETLAERGVALPADMMNGFPPKARGNDIEEAFALRGAGPGRKSSQIEAVNDYQDELQETFDECSSDLSQDVAQEEDDGKREALIAAALALLLASLIALGRKRINEAYNRALDGGAPSPEMLDDLSAALRENETYLMSSLIPAIGSKLRAGPAFPRKERQGLMRALNHILAAPSFEAWREGEPLDVSRMLRSPDGRPRLSVVSIAHLSDEERLFVVALLLDKVKTWMGRQGGTTAQRALVYMDELFGYFPPHPANPPTKRPLLTLLKQARAQGTGVVLATQNPVDLDYKGLANIGTWMVGTLQTQQDRERLKGGLTGAGLEASAVDAMLSSTRKRVFLLHDVHRPGPALLHSRFAMSYLRGPMTREEISRLMKDRAGAAPAARAAGAEAAPSPAENNQTTFATQLSTNQ